jgi:hypothetical protein
MLFLIGQLFKYLWLSFNYMPYLFYKKCFKSESFLSEYGPWSAISSYVLQPPTVMLTAPCVGDFKEHVNEADFLGF